VKQMLELKQSATDKVIPFLLVSSTDHINGVTGLSPTVTLSKNGAAFAAPAGAVAEIGNGYYKLTPNAADTNTLGLLILHASSAGADPSDRESLVVANDPYDAADLGLSSLAALEGRLPASPAAVGDAMTLDLTQAVPTSNTANTIGDALNAARAEGFGKWVRTGTTLDIYAPDGVTVVQSFTLDDPDTPTQRV
jgi:hypothetical protein